MCVEGIEKQTDKGKQTALVTWEKPTAIDNSGDILNVTCNPPSGTSIPLGQTSVTCEAIDKSGNAASCQIRVNITGTRF